MLGISKKFNATVFDAVLIGVLFLFGSQVVPARADFATTTLTHLYDFDGDLNDSVGGANVTSSGNYQFANTGKFGGGIQGTGSSDLGYAVQGTNLVPSSASWSISFWVGGNNTAN